MPQRGQGIIWCQIHERRCEAFAYLNRTSINSAIKQETWVSLIEKAYAKLHGDYAAIEGFRAGRKYSLIEVIFVDDPFASVSNR